MRRGKHWGWPLVLLAVAGLGALVQAQEPGAALTTPKSASLESTRKGNWLSRLWPWGKKTAAKEERVAAASPAPALSPAVLKQRAYLDWLRRMEVCDKLREIALQTNDAELSRKAEQLADRAYETYLKTAQRGPHTPISPEESILEQKLGGHAATSMSTGPAHSSLGGRKLRE